MKKLALLGALILVFQGQGQAQAQLVRSKARAPKPAQQSVAEQFAQFAGTAMGQKVAPDALKDGLPLGMVLMAEHRYSGTNLSRLLQKFREHTASFSGRWSAYQARLGLVRTAVKQAKELSAAGKDAEARDKLLTVITPVERDERSGKIAVKRDILEVSDAEIPALLQLAKTVVNAGSPEMLADIAAILYTRRRVSGVSSERLLWIDSLAKRSFTGLGFGLKAGASRAVNLVDKERYRALSDGKALASGLFSSVEDLGLARATIYDPKSAKKGGWALFSVGGYGAGVTVKVSATAVNVKVDKKWKEPHHCVKTKEITGYNPVTHLFIYRLKCQYKERKVKASMALKLAAPAPGWASAPRARLWIVGKVKRAGKNWKLGNGHVLDFRFLGSGTLLGR